MGEVRQAFVGGGANLGDRLATLRAAGAALRRWAGVHACESSSFYETEPVGVADQPRFLNVVFAVDSELAPETLLQVLQRIEAEHGRVRERRWGPRTLDLDLLFYTGETRTTAELTLPHPRMFERAFVLVPLRELLSRAEIRRRTDPEFVRAVESVRVDARGVVAREFPP